MLSDLHLSKHTTKAPLQVLLAALEAIDRMVLGEVSPKAFPATLINQLLPALYNIQMHFGILSTTRFYHLHMEYTTDSQHYLLPVMRAAVRGTGISLNQLISYLRDKKDGDAEQVFHAIIKKQGGTFNIIDTFSMLVTILKRRLQKQPKNIFASVSCDEDQKDPFLDAGALLHTFIRKYSNSNNQQNEPMPEDKEEHETEHENISGTKMSVLMSGSNQLPTTSTMSLIIGALLLVVL